MQNKNPHWNGRGEAAEHPEPPREENGYEVAPDELSQQPRLRRDGARSDCQTGEGPRCIDTAASAANLRTATKARRQGNRGIDLDQARRGTWIHRPGIGDRA